MEPISLQLKVPTKPLGNPPTPLTPPSSSSAWRSIRREKWEGELSTISGEIPQWLNGTYLRNGPGMFHVGDHNFRHLFDGYSTIVGVSFEGGRVFMRHSQLQSEAYRSAKEQSRVCYREFSEAPTPSNFLQNLLNISGLFTGDSLTDNANTGVIMLGDGRVVCLTETVKGSYEIDPHTLETIGRFKYSDNLKGLVHSAHPIVCDEEFITLIPDLMRPGYTVVRMLPGSNERTIIGRVKCRGGPTPGWVHSFAVTENYIVVPEMPLRYSAMNLLRAQPTPLYKFEWHPHSKAFIHVLCRSSGRVVASVEVPLFITFHFINAYEEKDDGERAVAIVADCCEHYANTSILDRLRLENLTRFQGQDVLPDARVGRFRIPLDGNPRGELEEGLDPEQHGRGLDMATINPNYGGKEYRFAYACGAHRPCNFPNTLSKLDLKERKAKNWYDPGCIPSEPFFIPNQQEKHKAEDDGVAVSLVSDRDGGGYVVLLDGETFAEIARAKMPYGLPYGLHGCWVPNKLNS